MNLRTFRLFQLAALVASFFLLIAAEAKQVVSIRPEAGDMTPIVRAALEGVTDSDVKLVFEKGSYFFRPDYAVEKYCFITNHGNGLKKIGFLFEGFDSVEIEGNGAELIFHGQMLPFQFESCGEVRVRDLTVDWDIPFTFLCEVVAVNEDEGWRDVKPLSARSTWNIHRGVLNFPNVDGFNYTKLGSTLPFDPVHERVIHGAWDTESHPRYVEELKDGLVRIHEPLKYYPPVGSLLSSKGDREHDRYAPAFEVKSCRNVMLERLVVHHALGMGFLFERSENITMTACGVHLRDGSDRVISSTADATHFCNCRGDILIENCRFENMLDDGTNVHGTYVEVDAVLDTHTVRVGLKHFEQSGFEFAGAGDEIWFAHQPSPDRASENEVALVKRINDRFIELKMKKALPKQLTKGDLLENKTWNPTFTMRGCVIRDHRARNIVLKTPKKILIENNDFSSMMSSIFFRGESFFWYESGGVRDVTIRNNRFEYCAYSGMEHAVLRITPRLGKHYDATALYDQNIVFENNTIKTFDNRIVWADRVDGLVIRNNEIFQAKEQGESLYPKASLFEFTHCRNVEISGNSYRGGHDQSVKADSATKKSLKVKKNKGF